MKARDAEPLTAVPSPKPCGTQSYLHRTGVRWVALGEMSPKGRTGLKEAFLTAEHLLSTLLLCTQLSLPLSLDTGTDAKVP